MAEEKKNATVEPVEVNRRQFFAKLGLGCGTRISAPFIIYRDVITNEMAQAHSKVVRQATREHGDLR
jgi:hypothetical protein